MNRNRQSRTDSKSRNRGRIVSFILHTLLLLLAFLPFFAMKAPEEASKEALVIQFDYPYNQYVKPEKFVDENTDMASKMSGSEAGGSTADEQPRQTRPQEAAPSRLASPSMTSAIKTNSPITTNIGEIPMPTPKIITHQAWQSVNDFNSLESDGVEEMKMIDWSDGAFGDDPGSGPGDGDEDSDISSEGFGTGSGGTGGQGNGTGDQNGNGSGPGGGTGNGGVGKNTGLGTDGNGIKWGVGMEGGLLNRKLVQRAQVERLAVKEGKISIYICVDRNGRVISTHYDIANSTLKDPAFVLKAEECAKSYVFAPDIMAPEKQCGKLSFIFRIK